MALVPPGDVASRSGCRPPPTGTREASRRGGPGARRSTARCASARRRTPGRRCPSGRRVLLPVGPHRGEGLGLADRPCRRYARPTPPAGRCRRSVVARRPPAYCRAFRHALPELAHGNVVDALALQGVDVTARTVRRIPDGCRRRPGAAARPTAGSGWRRRDRRWCGGNPRGTGWTPRGCRRSAASTGRRSRSYPRRARNSSRNRGVQLGLPRLVAVVVESTSASCPGCRASASNVFARVREVHVEGRAAEEVDLEPCAAGAGALGLRPQQRVAEPQHGPAARPAPARSAGRRPRRSYSTELHPAGSRRLAAARRVVRRQHAVSQRVSRRPPSAYSRPAFQLEPGDLVAAGVARGKASTAMSR